MGNRQLEGYESPIVFMVKVMPEKGFAASDISGWENGGSYEDSFGVNY